MEQSAWWIEIDRSKLVTTSTQVLHFVCEKEPGQRGFHYLQLPGSYLIKNQKELDVRSNNRYSMFLSAEQGNLFQDECGKEK